MFKSHANKSGKLDLEAIDRIFLPTESGRCPWEVNRETVYDRAQNFDPSQTGEGITLETWVGLWIKYVNIDTLEAFRDLVLIGYCGQLKDAIHLVKFKPKDVHSVPKTRKSFNCLVIAPNADLSSRFMDTFIQAEAREESKQENLDQPRSVVRTIKEKNPNDKDKFVLKYLMLTEVAAQDIESGDFLRDSELI